MNMINIILADDHELIREGIARIITKQPHINIVGEAADGFNLLKLVEQFQPHIVITDIKMPGMDGIEATRVISRLYPSIHVIALSLYDDDEMIYEMLAAGAKGYLVKNAPKKEFVDAIHAIIKKQSYFSEDICKQIVRMLTGNVQRKNNEPAPGVFSQKELQVIDLICRQFFTKEISEALNLSPRTVEGYRDSIMKKINARNTAGIVSYAISNHLYDPQAGNNTNS